MIAPEALTERGLVFLMHWQTDGDLRMAELEVRAELAVMGLPTYGLFLRYPDFYAPGFFEVWAPPEVAQAFSERRRDAVLV